METSTVTESLEIGSTVAIIRLAKKYYRRLNPRSPKEFWIAIKYLNKNKQSIPTLVHNCTVAHSDTKKADMLNSGLLLFLLQSIPPATLLQPVLALVLT